MKSIREKLETDEKIIFEVRPPFRSLVNPIIFILLLICIHLAMVLSYGLSSIGYDNKFPEEYFLLYGLMFFPIVSIISYYYEEFYVTDKRILTRSLFSYFKFKQIHLEDIKYVASFKIPILFIDWFLIKDVSRQTYIIFNTTDSSKFKDKFVTYIKTVENNSLNQEITDKMTSSDELKLIMPGIERLSFFLFGFKGNEWVWKNRKRIFYGLIVLGMFLGIAVSVLDDKQVSEDFSNLNFKEYRECNVANYKGFSILLPKQINSNETIYPVSTSEKLAYSLERATNDKLVYLDIRNLDDVYAQMENIKFRIGDLKSDEVFNKIEKAAFVIPEAMKIKDKIDYIDLSLNNISIKLIKEGQSHNRYTIKQICKED